MLKPVTIRNIPDPLASAVLRRARERRISLNKAVISLLEEGVGTKGEKVRPRYHDLDSLAGSWSREEARDFEKRLNHQRKIDVELWR